MKSTNMTMQRAIGTPKMHWYEENKKITPLQAVTNARKHYHRKYGQSPVSAEIPKEWGEVAIKIAAARHELKVTVDPGLQPRTVAVTHILDRESER